MKIIRFAALAAAIVLVATVAAPVRAAQGLRSFTFGQQSATQGVDPDSAAGILYCQSTGGLVELRKPVYGTNNSATQLVLSGQAVFCQYTAKDTSRIHVLESTLFTTKPTLAALAYYAKIKPAGCSTAGANPASCYCSQLGGSDLFGGISAAGGAWVLKGAIDEDLEACIFPDLSSIDSWGLFYHSAGIVRGIDLSKVLRYHLPPAGIR